MIFYIPETTMTLDLTQVPVQQKIQLICTADAFLKYITDSDLIEVIKFLEATTLMALIPAFKKHDKLDSIEIQKALLLRDYRLINTFETVSEELLEFIMEQLNVKRNYNDPH